MELEQTRGYWLRRSADALRPPIPRPHDMSHPRRPSSRRALTRALQLAREAVLLDSTNEDPEAAVQAYARSVALLNEVMDRVQRGEDSTESRRTHRRRSVAAQEEEVRRLQSIHDTYADRMNILSIIYSIPPAPYLSLRSLPPASMPPDDPLPAPPLPPLSEELQDNDDDDDIPLHTPTNWRASSHPLPPIPSPTDNTPRTSLHLAHPPSSPRGPCKPSAPPAPPPAPIINPSTSHGTISQRRIKSIDPPHDGRFRSFSQPNRRPSTSSSIDLPPHPPLPSSLNSRRPIKLTQSPDAGSPSIPSLTPQLLHTPSAPFVPIPQGQSTDPLRKPYYMMNLLATSMSSPTGGHITRRLHVPNEVWSIGGVKLPNVPEKIRALQFLLAALAELQMASSEVFGAGNVSSGMAMGIGSIGPKEANAWVFKLEDFSNVCDNVVNDFGKKIGVGEGFVLKKTTWGDKLSRRFEKFANGKKYGVSVFLHTQLVANLPSASTPQLHTCPL